MHKFANSQFTNAQTSVTHMQHNLELGMWSCLWVLRSWFEAWCYNVVPRFTQSVRALKKLHCGRSYPDVPCFPDIHCIMLNKVPSPVRCPVNDFRTTLLPLAIYRLLKTMIGEDETLFQMSFCLDNVSGDKMEGYCPLWFPNISNLEKN